LRCPCQRGAEVWGELWWTERKPRWVFFDDDRSSKTYAEQIERCPACGRRLERKVMVEASASASGERLKEETMNKAAAP
jgi:hypothetical protein